MYTRCNYTACCDSRVILIRFLLEKPCICMRLVSAQKYDAQSGWYMHCTCATVDFKGRLELEGSKYMCILILSKLFSSTYITSFLLRKIEHLNSYVFDNITALVNKHCTCPLTSYYVMYYKNMHMCLFVNVDHI